MRAWCVQDAILSKELADRGIAVVDNVLPAALLRTLQLAARLQLAQAPEAGIGRGENHVVDALVRRDRIRWLDASDEASAGFLAAMEQLRQQLNQQLFLGLFRYESHYASYAPGAFYRRHRDAFRGQHNRKLSTVFYLNDDWQPQDGGELVIYADDETTEVKRVSPQANRLVLFLSEEFPHEVLTAARERFSIAGWFRGA